MTTAPSGTARPPDATLAILSPSTTTTASRTTRPFPSSSLPNRMAVSCADVALALSARVSAARVRARERVAGRMRGGSFPRICASAAARTRPGPGQTCALTRKLSVRRTESLRFVGLEGRRRSGHVRVVESLDVGERKTPRVAVAAPYSRIWRIWRGNEWQVETLHIVVPETLGEERAHPL